MRYQTWDSFTYLKIPCDTNQSQCLLTLMPLVQNVSSTELEPFPWQKLLWFLKCGWCWMFICICFVNATHIVYHILCDVRYRFLSNLLDLMPNESFYFIQASQLDVSDIFFQAPLSRHRNSGVGSKDRRCLHAAGCSTNRSAPMEMSGHVSPWAIHGVFDTRVSIKVDDLGVPLFQETSNMFFWRVHWNVSGWLLGLDWEVITVNVGWGWNVELNVQMPWMIYGWNLQKNKCAGAVVQKQNLLSTYNLQSARMVVANWFFWK